MRTAPFSKSVKPLSYVQASRVFYNRIATRKEGEHWEIVRLIDPAYPESITGWYNVKKFKSIELK